MSLLLSGSATAGPQPAAARYQTVVTASRPTPPPTAASQAVVLEGEVLRSAPGTLGDPFRAIGLLPGVTAPVPFAPMFVLRGTSPGMSGFYLDGMRLPQLFHLLVGGGVVHGGLIERVAFHPGAYDVTYGRLSGGVIAAETRPARDDRHHVEAELRLFDVNALVELRLGRSVRVVAGGHYGYPGPLLGAIDNKVDLSYWDYVFRLDLRGLTIEALGAFDRMRVDSGALGISGSLPKLGMMFHRVQARQRLARPGFVAEAALVFGLDEVGNGRDDKVRKIFGEARAALWRIGPIWTLQLGLSGELARISAGQIHIFGFLPWMRSSQQGNAGIEDVASGRRDDLGEIGDERLGASASALLQLSAVLWHKRLELVLGGRADVYHAAGFTAVGFDPRAMAKLRVLPWLALRVAGGIYQQPPSFPIQLPGIDTFALQLGLQRAVHAAVTEELRLPRGFEVQATGYYQALSRTTDLPPLGALVCAAPPIDRLSGATAQLLRQVDGQTYGLELLVRRSQGRLSGWVAYTLSRSERYLPCGLRPSDYDQTHALNVVAQLQLPRGVQLGARLLVNTGRPETLLRLPDLASTLRNNVRMPTYVQLDVRAEKQWQPRRSLRLVLSAELLNATFSESVLMLGYPSAGGPLGVDPSRPDWVRFRWLLPSLGLRLVY